MGVVYACTYKTALPSKKADTFATPTHFGNLYNIPADNPMHPEAVALGRMLFYEPLLSGDTTLSCASCHEQARAFTDGQAFSRGIKGHLSDRSAMSLVNLLWNNSFFWDGRAKSLETQALVPIQNPREMGLSIQDAALRLQATALYPPLFRKAFGSRQIRPEHILKALAQFERTLISANSRYDQIVRGEVQASERELRAINLFMTHPVPEANLRGGNCGDCHGSHLTTLHTFHDNGLEAQPQDEGRALVTGQAYDKGKMRAPSLRNIALTAPYMHDGRFKTLREVLDHYNEHIQASPNLDPLIMEATNEPEGQSLALTEEEKEDILLFLHLLTDSTFIQDPRFSNPFVAPNRP
ncbi:MAG: cytochrome-c peroxidase [Microscillaceae bacterium]|nr:cytochrome-c peroxidase [Microscillaceae bacterium]